MDEQFVRNVALIGKDKQDRLKNSRVAVFGLGGVGGHTVEALARCGVGQLDLIDKDRVDVTNINRQIIALHSTVGIEKTEVMKNRVLDINPDCKVNAYTMFFLPETADRFDFSRYDYIVDAVDNVTAKITLCQKAAEVGVPIISCMGTGNKLDPQKLCVADIYKTTVCPLARVMRRELKNRGIKSLKVVYSTEETQTRFDDNGAPIISSISFVPSVAGLLMAAEVVRDLTK